VAESNLDLPDTDKTGFGPCPTASPEAAAASLAQQCKALREEVLRKLNIPLGGKHDARRVALLALQTPGAVAAPGATAPTTSGSAQASPTATASSSWQATPCSAPAAPTPRVVGLDLGGVITQQGEPDKLVSGALKGVAQLVKALGSKHVVIISRVNSDRAAERHMETLYKLNFFTSTGFNPEQVYWSRAFQGRESKGPGPSQSDHAGGRQKSITASYGLRALRAGQSPALPRSGGPAAAAHTFRGRHERQPG